MFEVLLLRWSHRLCRESSRAETNGCRRTDSDRSRFEGHVEKVKTPTAGPNDLKLT